jgi:MFS family permease
MDQLTEDERKDVAVFRVVWFMWESTFGIVAASRLDKLMRLCADAAGSAGAAGLYAKQAGICWSVCCALGLLVNPLLASLSDTFGRKPFLFLTRAGLAFWFLGAHWGNSVRTMMLAEILSWSAFGASLTIQNAAFSDVFGDRPELSSEISSRMGGTTGIGGFLGPFVRLWAFS